jgi:P-type Cu2+ transporter
MSDTRDLSHFVRHIEGGVARIDLAVEGMACAGCMSKIERGLSTLPSVTRARANLTNRRVAVEWN